jgi:hypothetical protein
MANLTNDDMLRLKENAEAFELIKLNIQIAKPIFSEKEMQLFTDKITTAITLTNYIIDNYRYMPHENYIMILRLTGEFAEDVTKAILFQKKE